MYTHLKPVKVWSLHGTYARATLTTLLALALAEPALAHLEIRPGLVAQGAAVNVRVELPQLRAGAPPERLEVEGPGIEVLSSRLQEALGSETIWSVRLRTVRPPGVVPLILRAVYADGRSVEVDERLTVVPPAATSAFPWGGVIAGALLALGFAGISLHLARRKA